MTRLKNYFYSFAVQLFILHLRRNVLLLLPWVVLFAIILNGFGSSFGIPILFLDPEYLGKVGYVSFFLIGGALGAFIMTFQISSYILNSFRFPFLATLERPFATYVINNSVIPLAYLVLFLVNIARFQIGSELATTTETILSLLSLLGGFIFLILIVASYFFRTNKSLPYILVKKKKKGEQVYERLEMKQEFNWESVQRASRVWPVHNYLNKSLRTRLVRGVEHYDERLLVAVFRQNHFNALFVQIFSLVTLIALGYLIEYPVFIIPAGASIFILFSTVIMLIGAFNYWTWGWRTLSFLLLIGFISLLIEFGAFDYQNKAFGLDYTEIVPYDEESIHNHVTFDQIEADRSHTILILNNWLRKHNAEQKPKMVIVNASGGGHRASFWTFKVMQELEKTLGDKLMNSTVLFTGASGGMLGLAYYRELFLQKTQGKNDSITHRKYAENISKDLLNPITFTIVVNDLFYPWRKFTYGQNTYRKDRAYVFEKYFHLNTDQVLEKRLADYHEPEFNMQIPMMVLAPVIIEDERKLFISAQPVSYLVRPFDNNGELSHSTADGIEFRSFFRQNNADSLRFSSALRMNATYPYILPNVSLPTSPRVEVMDAGIRDNYGFETTARFLYAFKEWIKTHTSGVVIVNINSSDARLLGEEYSKRNILDRLLNPIGNLYSNWTEIQDYHQNHLFYYVRDWFDGQADWIDFNYIPGEKDETASMSFHLNQREKNNIESALEKPENRLAFEYIKEMLR